MISKHTATDAKPADVFKTFPEFSKLTYADREKYEALIKDLPPLASLPFSNLMTWWNSLDSAAVATLNGNLIISYWLPGSDKVSGISFIGTNKVDESICEILDHLKRKGERPRLVHVPEFIISHMQHPELFEFKSERNDDEYVYEVSKFYPITKNVSFRRHRIKKFMSHTKDREVVVKSLDISEYENKQLLLQCAAEVPRKGTVNEIARHSDEALVSAIENAEYIGVDNVCLFVNHELHAFMLFSRPADKRYIIFSHVMVRYDIPYTYDYMVYGFAKWLTESGVQYANLDSDLGMPLLRMLKLALGPTEYFRKYTIEPAN